MLSNITISLLNATLKNYEDRDLMRTEANIKRIVRPKFDGLVSKYRGSSSQMRTHAKKLLKPRVPERSLLSIFFIRYVYDLFQICTPVIFT
jgi:hypothetical protein